MVRGRNESPILNRKVFPALSDFFPEIKETLESRLNEIGHQNIPKSVWVRMVSNSRPREGQQNVRKYQYVLVGGGTLTSSGNLRGGFEPVYNYQRNIHRSETVKTSPISEEDQTFVDNSVGFFRPVPGIDNISISLKGQFGTFRKATVSWTAPSIFDLEELAPYFLTTGVSVLLDWGWSDIDSPANIISVVDGKYESLVVDYFKNPSKIFENHVLQSKGKYDAMIGVITNFSFSMNDDGTYSCSTEISAPSELMLGINIDKQYSYADPNCDTQKSTIKEFLNKKLDEKLLEMKDNDPSLKNMIIDVGKPFFNRIGKNASTSLSGNDPSSLFVSWGFFEDKIINEYLAIKPKNQKDVSVFKMNSRDVLISNDPILFSTDPTVLLIIKTGVKSGGPNSRDVSNVDQTINFNSPEDSNYSGIMRHLFVNTQVIKQAFNESDTLKDAIMSILNQMSKSAGDLWEFELRSDPLDEHSLKVIDLSYSPNKDATLDNTIVFGGLTGKSLAKNISLQTKMTNQLASKFLMGKNKDISTENDSALNDDADSGISTIYGTHYDIIFRDLIFDSPPSDCTGEVNPESRNTTAMPPSQLSEQELAEQLKSGVDLVQIENDVRFAIFNSETAEDLSEYLRRKTVPNKRRHQVLYPIEVSVTVDGISGILPGTVFRVDNIPQIYRDNGIFQIIGIEHEISTDNWDTTLRAIFRITNFSPNELKNVAVSTTNQIDSKLSNLYSEEVSGL